MTFGGIEAGGTKWVCGVGDGGGTVVKLETFPTTTPQETISRAADFFMQDGPLDGLGVGSFGPIDVHRASPTWGQITTTPKPGWADTQLIASIRAALDIPVAFDTDVNAAALAESR